MDIQFQQQAADLVAQMTLEEKAGLCSGETFWCTKAVERLGLPAILLSDGPHGLRKQGEKTDHLGLISSQPATCLPAACAMAASWDEDLAHAAGELIGEEALAQKVDIVLGPGLNIKRSPLCGRNFEYYSEDPLLSGKMGAATVRGIQSKGVGACAKHFAVNNLEEERMSVSAMVDMRTLHEIYLSAFETVVRESAPWSVMCAYNRINGTYASDNAMLLDDVLRKSWGFEGFVVTDWGAMHDKADAVKAGCELEMPTSYGYNDKKLVAAVQCGALDEKVLNTAVQRIVAVMLRCVQGRQDKTYDIEQHHRFARRCAADCMVLLQNKGDILPLNPSSSYMVAGQLATKPRYQGGGSSHVNPHTVAVPLEEICATAGKQIVYCDGYLLQEDAPNQALIEETCKQAAQHETVLLFLGLPDRYESEGFDRAHIHLPENQLALLQAVSSVNKNVVVVLFTGGVVETESWRNQCSAILLCWLGGQAVGGAVADVVFGNVSPSGKLPETFPKRLCDTPSYLNDRPFRDEIHYREALYVGYRHYDAVQADVSFPFGFGLSYTQFGYGGLALSSGGIQDTQTLDVTCIITNTGKRAGKEIVQLYVEKNSGHVPSPIRQLRAFQKVALEPGETKVVQFTLHTKDFAYFDPDRNRYVVESTTYTIAIGSSSRELLLSAQVDVQGSEGAYLPPATIHSRIGTILENPQLRTVMQPVVAGLEAAFGGGTETGVVSQQMLEKTIANITLQTLVQFTGGQFDDEQMQAVIDLYNRSLPVNQ